MTVFCLATQKFTYSVKIVAQIHFPFRVHFQLLLFHNVP